MVTLFSLTLTSRPRHLIAAPLAAKLQSFTSGPADRSVGRLAASTTAYHTPDQKQACTDGDASDHSRHALTRWCEAFDGDGCRHRRHYTKVHDPDDQQDRRQTGAAAAAVESEAEAFSPGRVGNGWRGWRAPGRVPAAGKVTLLPRGELQRAAHQDDDAG